MELQKALEEYEKYFSEIISEIQKYIKTRKKQRLPKYEDNLQ